MQTSPLSIVSTSTPLISTRRQGQGGKHETSAKRSRGQQSTEHRAKHKKKEEGRSHRKACLRQVTHLLLTGNTRATTPSPWISGLYSRCPTQMSPPTRLPTSRHEPELRTSLRCPLKRLPVLPLAPPLGQQPHLHQLRPSLVVRSQSPVWLPQQEHCTPRRRRPLRPAPTRGSEEAATRRRVLLEERQDSYQQHQEGRWQ